MTQPDNILSMEAAAAGFNVMLAHPSLGMALLNLEGQWLKVSPGLCKLLGYSEQALLHTSLEEIMPPLAFQTTVDLLSSLLNGKQTLCQIEQYFVDQSGQLIPLMLTLGLVPDATKRCYFMLVQQNLYQTSDSTGSFKLKQFEHDFNQVLASAKRNHKMLAVLAIELAQTELDIEQIYARLKACMRLTDLLAVSAHNELLMVLTDVHMIEDISIASSRILDTLRYSQQAELREANISIGISIYPNQGESYTLLLEKAQIALQSSVLSGGSQYQFYC